MKTKLSIVLKAIKTQAKLPPEERRLIHIAGPAGVGKTHAVLGLDPQAFLWNVPIHSPEDIGVPHRTDAGRLEYLLNPEIAKAIDTANEKIQTKRIHVWIFDELAQGDPQQQKSICPIIYDRVILGHKVPENVVFVSTGNLREHQSGVGSALAHLVNRMKVYEVGVDVDEWMDWGATRINSDILAYIAMKPAGLYCNSDDASDEAIASMYRDASRGYKPYPTPRSWTALSSEISACPEASLEDMASHVGPERASEFQAMRNTKVPSHPDLLEGRAEMPTDPMGQWLCVARMGQLFTPGNSTKTCNVIKKLNPEMIEVFWMIAGKTAQAYIKTKGVEAKSPKLALLGRDGAGSPYFPGVSEILNDPRYSAMLEAQL